MKVLLEVQRMERKNRTQLDLTKVKFLIVVNSNRKRITGDFTLDSDPIRLCVRNKLQVTTKKHQDLTKETNRISTVVLNPTPPHHLL